MLDKNGELIRQLTVTEAFEAIRDGVATGGMIPKLETAIAAVDAGVEAVVIMDGRRPHAMLMELFHRAWRRHLCHGRVAKTLRTGRD